MKNKRLEQYTIKNPQEVLIVKAIINNQEDEIIIFKGFSSSLMAETACDPDVPVLPENSTIVSIARLKSPYNPINAQYLQKDISWEQMEDLLTQLGI